MTATQRTKQLLKDAFPSMYLRWRFLEASQIGGA